jgi:hypothetical protein
MKRLYETSLGRLELEIEPGVDDVSGHLFDAEGQVIREGGDEWTWGDVQDLLQKEIGLPEEEAKSISEAFLEAARAEGHEQAEPGSNIMGIVIGCSLLGLIGLGIWTIGTWIF